MARYVVEMRAQVCVFLVSTLMTASCATKLLLDNCFICILVTKDFGVRQHLCRNSQISADFDNVHVIEEQKINRKQAGLIVPFPLKEKGE